MWIAILCSIFVVLSLPAQISNEDISINLAVVACGDRAPETIVLLKSALMFTKKKLHFYIFTERELNQQFVEQFSKWPTYIQDKFNYSLIEPSFPSENRDEWRRLFKLCASQRIFLPEILKSVDSLLYVDTDVLFLSDLADVWQHFAHFNESQIAALAPEHEEPNMGWYNRFARHPYYGRLGLNSGVMLMNLTRMRDIHFVSNMLPIYNEYKYNITWGDQCLLNIFFHFHPDKLYVYDCSWNYRPDHCMYGSNCKIAEHVGARILHGSRRVFQNDKEPVFKAIYNVFKLYEFDETQRARLDADIKNIFEEERVAITYCGQTKIVFSTSLENQLKVHESVIRECQINHENNQLANASALRLDGEL